MTSYVLGGGCFWCLDAVYRGIQGVTKVESGYSGGTLLDAPNYYQVATGTTGFAEAVRIVFDETIIPADVILAIYFLIHDPTTLNRQGADKGTQYRSIMFYDDDTQKEAFETARDRAQQIWNDPIVTEITPLDIFYVAEEEHQDYFNKNPEAGYCSIVIAPKVTKARKAYAKWFKEEE
ncbi:MAG TPA: peptide-methionine (S)-S-oxide reductase MsrA [Candidatus Saccharimonadales bacterium]|nr:peptide-methionine (S)-S-oxide reductase MsrA [Candidatus Saccharimonadales bacterium]